MDNISMHETKHRIRDAISYGQGAGKARVEAINSALDIFKQCGHWNTLGVVEVDKEFSAAGYVCRAVRAAKADGDSGDRLGSLSILREYWGLLNSDDAKGIRLDILAELLSIYIEGY